MPSYGTWGLYIHIVSAVTNNNIVGHFNIYRTTFSLLVRSDISEDSSVSNSGSDSFPESDSESYSE